MPLMATTKTTTDDGKATAERLDLIYNVLVKVLDELKVINRKTITSRPD